MTTPQMNTRRIIVCGTRDWDDLEVIQLELERLDMRRPAGMTYVLVHGASGHVDLYAEEHVVANYTNLGWTNEAHPADWKKYGRAGGPIRNREMAKLGAWLCLAFWDGKSRGTLNMITEAVRHGIFVRIVPGAVAYPKPAPRPMKGL